MNCTNAILLKNAFTNVTYRALSYDGTNGAVQAAAVLKNQLGLGTSFHLKVRPQEAGNYFLWHNTYTGSNGVGTISPFLDYPGAPVHFVPWIAVKTSIFPASMCRKLWITLAVALFGATGWSSVQPAWVMRYGGIHRIQDRIGWEAMSLRPAVAFTQRTQRTQRQRRRSTAALTQRVGSISNRTRT